MPAEALAVPALTHETFDPLDAEELGDLALDALGVTSDPPGLIHHEFESVSPRPPEKRSLKDRLGEEVAVRGAFEIVGLGVDMALMLAGANGVGLMQNMGYREITATTPEVAGIDKVKEKLALRRHKRLNPEATHKKEVLTREEKLKKAAKHLGHTAATVTVAIIAQKAGIHAAHFINESMNHGYGHYAVPLTSKVGAVSAYSYGRGKVPIKF